MRKRVLALAATFLVGLSGCDYNTFQTSHEQITASWPEAVNQYQRRVDLLPNLVSTVKGEVNFEQSTLIKVIEARAQETSKSTAGAP